MKLETLAPSALLLLISAHATAQTGWNDITTQPHPDWMSSTCYDSTRQSLVVFRHFGGAMTVSEFDGAGWTITPAVGYPSIASLAGGWAGYDPTNDSFLLTMTDPSFQTQTVTWDRSTWTLRAVSSFPPTLFGLVWHSGRESFIALSLANLGSSNSSLRLVEWNGAGWAFLTARTAPVTSAALAYDDSLDELVVLAINGSQSSTFRVDLATSAWQQVTHPPLGTPHLALATDQANGRLFGLASNRTTLEFTGSGWERHAHGTAPPSNSGFGYTFVHFPPLNGFVLVQNQPNQLERCGSYLYRPAEHVAPKFGLHHPGCSTMATPSIDLAAGSPLLGQSFDLRVGGLSPTSSRVFLTSGFRDDLHQGGPLPFEMSGLGLPGCFLNVECRITDSTAAHAGSATFQVLLPLDLDFIGLRFFYQALVIDPQLSNALGAIVTDSMTGTVGW